MDMTNRTSVLKRIIGRLVVITLLISLLITACSADGSSESAVNGLPLALAILFIAILAGGVAYLVKSGNFQEWASAGINAGKWKFEERKLRGQKEEIEGEKANLIAKLGERTWEARVSHASYQEPYEVLAALADEKQTLVGETDALEAELKQVHNSRVNLVDDYSKQLKDLTALKKDVEKQLDKSKSQDEKLSKELEKAYKEQNKVRAVIDEKGQKLAEVEASDAPDKDQQVESLTKSLKTLEGSLAKASESIANIELERSKLEIEQQPLADKLTRFEDQISTVEADQKQALAPLDQRIAELEGEVQSRKDQIDALREKMTENMHRMGVLVEAARPESEELTAAYFKIDKVKTNLEEVTQEHYLVRARLEACDQGMVRNFYLMAAGILLLVVLIVVFFVLAFG
jgi:chromosome segregation ATPase